MVIAFWLVIVIGALAITAGFIKDHDIYIDWSSFKQDSLDKDVLQNNRQKLAHAIGYLQDARVPHTMSSLPRVFTPEVIAAMSLENGVNRQDRNPHLRKV